MSAIGSRWLAVKLSYSGGNPISTQNGSSLSIFASTAFRADAVSICLTSVALAYSTWPIMLEMNDIIAAVNSKLMNVERHPKGRVLSFDFGPRKVFHIVASE